MSFLNSSLFLLLFPLVGLPLLIHLLNRSFPRHFRFPSIELIKATLAQRSRLHHWRHLILLLLRTILLLLLLFAFLLPVLRRFGMNPAAGNARNLLIVFDHSVSMEHRGDGPTSRERAIHEAVKLIDSLSAKDTLNVLLMDPNPSTAFESLSHDHLEAKRFVNRISPGLGRADINLASTMAKRLLKGVPRPEIYYISDFQRKNWANADFTDLPRGARLFFVNVGPARSGNRAILEAQLDQSPTLAGGAATIEMTIGNFDDQAFNGRLTILLDREAVATQDVAISPWSQGKVTARVPIGAPGVHLCELRLPDDALEYDNHFYLTLPVQEKEEVLIVTDESDERKSGVFFLRMALNPFENEEGSLLPRVISSSEISPIRLAGVQKMFFLRVNRLNADKCAVISKFLFGGGGLVYFLDGPADPENLESLQSIIGADSMPLRLSRRRTSDKLGTGAQQIVRGDFKSPYLKLFQGAGRQDLSLLEFYDYYQAGATGAGGVLLVYGDQSPAMASLHYGLGTLLLMNFSAGELSSNLARQRIFPAWMQELVLAVSSEESAPPAYVIGETAHAEVWQEEIQSDFRTPSGTPLSVKRERISDRRVAVTFTPDQLGFYTLSSSRLLYAYGINTSPDEADLRQIDKDVLPAEFVGKRQAHFVAGSDDYEELAKGQLIFHWFVLAALAFLFLESAFQYWLLRRREV